MEQWSVLAVDADSGGVIAEEHPELLLPTASVGKLFLLHHLAELLDEDPASGRVLLRKDSVEPVADSGLWQHLDVPELSVEDCARLVGTVSDNLATNVLLAHVGLAPVQEVARRLAPCGSLLHDRVRDVRRPTDPPTLSTGCAADWAAYFRNPHPKVLEWLAAAADLSMVSSAFDLDPLAHVDSTPRLWSKTGTDTGTRAEVGLVEVGERRVAFAAIVHFDGPVGPVLAHMRELGELILTRSGAAAGDS